jgi:hypothetical protein
VSTRRTQRVTQSATPARKDQECHAAVAAAASADTAAHSEPPAEYQGRRATDVARSQQHQDGFDDGLVHSHGWAMSNR